MKVLIVHNILWAHYKGAVFSELHKQAQQAPVDVRFLHIAETSSERMGLSSVDLSFHQYPYTLLFRSSFQKSGAWRRSLRLIHATHQIRPDLIVLPGYHDAAYWALWLYSLFFVPKRIIALDSTHADHVRSRSKEWIKRLFVQFCDAAFTYGQRGFEYLESLGMRPYRIVQRCQAAPNDYLLKVAEEQLYTTQSEPKILGTEPYFLYVGRLAPEKDLGTMLESFAVAYRERPDYKLYLAGSGPEESTLREQAATLGVAEAVRFLGPKKLESLVHLYRNARALILPSLSEPWGLVVNEAFLMQCPAIVSDRCGCVPDLIFPGKTGYSFPAGDRAALTEAIRKMQDPAADRAAMGRSCSALISEFSPARAASQMLACFMKFEDGEWR